MRAGAGGADAAADETWLLTEALVGRTAYQLLEAHAGAPRMQLAVVDALADVVRHLHVVPVEACPFASDHTRRLVHARARLEAGLVDEDDFGDAHRGWSAHRVWDAMMALLPFAADPVVTHGDFSLDNLVLAENEGGSGVRVVGCLDVGRVGVADRYQDLAILWDCLGEFDDALQARLFARYGMEAPDERKLRFHLALDEFF